MNIKIICLITAIFLLLAIIPFWDYSYYILLRWGVCFSSIIVAVGFYNSRLTNWAIIFGIIAFLFNPLFPVYLSRAIWTPIDLISAILFILAGFAVKEKREKNI
jgi:hypothetical protein